jgi:hypothetical protein
MRPEFCTNAIPRKNEGAGNAGRTLHPRSRVQRAQGTRTRAYRFSGGIRHPLRNGFTAYAVLSPATNSSCHRRCRLDGSSIRSDRCRHRQLDTSNGCQDHTVLPYAATRLRQKAQPGVGVVHLARDDRSQACTCPAISCAPDAAASTASLPAFVTIAIRPSCRERTGRAGSADLPDVGSGIFFSEGLDRFWVICPTGIPCGGDRPELSRCPICAHSERWPDANEPERIRLHHPTAAI